MDYFLFTLIAPIILVILAIVLAVAWRFRAQPPANILLVAIIMNLGWLLVNYLELIFKDLPAKIILARSSYFFIGGVGISWFVFALHYTGRQRYITRRAIYLLALPWLIATLLVFTNEAHFLTWETYRLIDAGFGLNAILITQYGPAFWPTTIYMWGVVMIGFVLIVRDFLRASPFYRRQTIWILIACAVPLVFNFFYVLQIIPGLEKDYTVIAFGLAVSLLVIGILRFRLFQLAPVARETLVDQLGDGMLVVDLNLTVVDNNPAAGQLLNQPMRLVGSPAGQLFPGLADLDSHLPRQAKLPVELQYQTQAGRILKLRIWGLSDAASQVNGWLILMEDVSAAQQALTDLRKSEELFRSVVQSAREGVAVLDLEGRITYASPRMLEMFACASNQDLISKPIFHLVAPDSAPQAAANFQRLIVGEKPAAEIYEHVRHNGSTFFGESLGALLRDQNGHPYGLVFLVRDISARLGAEAARIRMAQILQTVLDNDNIILTSSNQEGLMVLWSQGAEKITGYSAEEATHSTRIYENIYPDPAYRQAMNDLRLHLQSGGSANSQIRIITRAGELKHIAMFSRSLRDEQGVPVGAVNVGLDITTRIQAEQTLQVDNANLEELVTSRTLELQQTVHRLEGEILARRQAEQKLVSSQENLANRLAEQSRQLAALYEVILTGGQPLEPGDLLDALLDKILLVTSASACAVYQHHSASQELGMVAQHGLADAFISGIKTLPLASPGQIACPALPGLEACLGAPIHLLGQVTGALLVWRESQHPFSIEDLAISNALADQIGIILENARLRELIQETATQEERRRLARDLHDSVTQSLHSLNWLTDLALNRYKQNQLDKMEDTLHKITESARQALKEMRLLLYESLPPASPQLGLVEALRLRLESVEQRSGLHAHLEIGRQSKWPPEWEAQLLAIAIEALNNALKHARASQVGIHLRGGRTWCRMRIEDNGIGFDPRHVPAGGLGFQSMHERASALGGSLEISSTPNQGTCVLLTIGSQPRTKRKERNLP